MSRNYYPRGKLNNDDEGACLISVSVTDKTVVIDFGKDIKWIGMDKQAAIALANTILDKADSIC
jgi:hypothetical protein